MKIRVGIVGYGNLGKSVEKRILEDKRFKLICIFSRRNVRSVFNTKVEKYENILNYLEKIDIMIMCGGSKTDLWQMIEVSKHFHTIDSFDNHNKIPKYLEDMKSNNKKNKKCSICCCGWDPGLFSLMRTLFCAVDNNSYTFWGKGVSQGHSQAIRKINGVVDAVQYTIPNKTIIKNINKGLPVLPNFKTYHIRECLVVANGNRKEIEAEIKNMPDYFKGYKTRVKFITEKKMAKHKELFHGGMVLTNNNKMRFELKLKSNPDFTAQIIVAYLIALNKLISDQRFGAFSVLDIPFSYLIDKKTRKNGVYI